jgi:hypothetical protein
VQEIPHALDDAADQQHAHSLPFRYSMSIDLDPDWGRFSEIRPDAQVVPCQKPNAAAISK